MSTIYRVSAINPTFRYPIFPIEENLRFREGLYRRAESDKNLSNYVANLFRADVAAWIDCTAWSKDPRVQPAIFPFVLYDFQTDFVRRIKKLITDQSGDLCVLKSKDMGVSWCVLYVLQHEFQFESGADFRVGSRKEDFVDKIGVIDTLLEKVRFNLGYQPRFLIPKSFETEKDFRENTTYMRLLNKSQNSSIIGESANNYFGSGGRSKALFLDEFALWEKNVDESAWTSTADQTRCRIVVSTPKGSANKFARLIKGTSAEKIERLTLHWSLHPVKNIGAYYDSNGQKITIDLSNDPATAFKLWIRGIRVRSIWYDAEDARRTEADLAQEVDCDLHKSGSVFFNSRALATQTIWKYLQRSHPDSTIPFGRYIRGKLIETQDKIKFVEVHNADGWLRVFEIPRPTHQYTLAADSSEGLLKGDESAGIVINKTTGNTVAAWNYLKSPQDFAQDIRLVGWWYNEADVAPENNNHGYSTCEHLVDKSHVKLYFARNEKGETTIKRGFTTSKQTRRPMLDGLANQIDKSSIELRDECLIEQCKTFIRNNDRGGEPEADGSFHDDLIIAMAIAQRVTEQIPYSAQKPVNSMRQIEAVQKITSVRNAGFGFRSKNV